MSDSVSLSKYDQMASKGSYAEHRSKSIGDMGTNDSKRCLSRASLSTWSRYNLEEEMCQQGNEVEQDDPDGIQEQDEDDAFFEVDKEPAHPKHWNLCSRRSRYNFQTGLSMKNLEQSTHIIRATVIQPEKPSSLPVLLCFNSSSNKQL